MLALVLAAGGELRAQEQEQEQAAPTAEKPAGTYQGVAPGEGVAAHPPRRGRTPTVTWLGFQPQPGGAARVFVQLDRDVSHAQEVRGGELVISLAGARVARSNTERFLDTRFFDTPVERVSIERARRRPGGSKRGRGLELVVRFKNPADAREAAVEMATRKDGYTYLTVDVTRDRAAAAAKP